MTTEELDDETMCLSVLTLDTTVTVYCRRIPFCSVSGGGFQEREIDREFSTLRVTFLGGPDGAAIVDKR